MKKTVLFVVGIVVIVALFAENKLYIHKTSGSLISILVSKIDSITFGNNNTEMNIYKTDTTVTNMLVSAVDSLNIVDEQTLAYTAPTYADDYSAISSYDNRASWNLGNVHDPSVVKCGSYWYMYGTDASYGNVLNGYGHFPYKYSRDLVNWYYRGCAMSQTPPTWVRDSLNAMRARLGLAAITNPSYGYWAPCIRKVGNKYRMYYSIIVDNYIGNGLQNTTANFDNTWTERAFIGMMESTDLATNVWVDKGYVISSVSDKTSWARTSTSDWSAYFKWNAIDPTYIVTPEGNHWLIYGSWHSGIPEVQLDSTTGKPLKLNVLADYGTRIARRVANDANRWQGQEGPEIMYNPKTGYYYLFLAYDELSVNYNTRVCRSKTITGPFLGYNGANITTGADCYPIITHPYKFNNHSGWVGFSHCCVFQNPDTGDWFYCSQARLPANTNGNAYSNAIMMGHVRKIMWTDDGWPVVLPERYANVPQTPITDADLVGNWENITLNYVAGVQQTSTTLTLQANYVATGAIAGTWTYNANTKTLTIGTQKLKLQRELNWESSPRVPTIVYSGLNILGRSLWGKKVN
ncbi:MAG: arabinan endo-1,5-alpha-L-arabinosidase [Paludibacter sp.]|nr:arabinan endo-1,5-alpha-L-arabinosidase [Paludibacter sp.]